MDDIIIEYKKKIKEYGQTNRWFRLRFIPEMNYFTMMHQLSGYSSLSDKLRFAIKKYLYNE